MSPQVNQSSIELFSKLSIVNSLEVITTLSTCFVCEICHNFMMDICTFPCGHKFCKFCGLSWLRLESSCPICYAETYKPFSTRCYEMDSVIDDMYPQLYQFYDAMSQNEVGKAFLRRVGPSDPVHFNCQNVNDLEFDYVESIRDLRDQMEENDSNGGSKTLSICSPLERDNIRKMRRALSERKGILLAAPCTSILQKLATLGWGTSAAEQSISAGMRTVVWIVLCYVFWNFLYTFHHSWFDGGVRTLVYSCLILIAANLMQMQLFLNPQDGPNLLDFELWEYRYPVNDGSNIGRNSGTFPRSTYSIINQSNRRCANNQGVWQSKGSPKECEEDNTNAFELEQIIQWKRGDKLDFETMLKMVDSLGTVIANPYQN